MTLTISRWLLPGNENFSEEIYISNYHSFYENDVSPLSMRGACLRGSQISIHRLCRR